MKRLITFLFLGAMSALLPINAQSRELVVSGTLSNSSAKSNLYLNDIAASFAGLSANHLALNANSFFANVPGILLPNETYSESELFRLQLDLAAGLGDFAAAIVFRGGNDIIANDDLASIACQILTPAIDPIATAGLGLDTAVYLFTRGNASTDAVTIAADSLSLSFIPNSNAPGVNYIVEASTDLVNWSAVDVEEISLTDPTPPNLRTFRYDNSASPNHRAFLRLRVEQK